jgi:hypothetical protein
VQVENGIKPENKSKAFKETFKLHVLHHLLPRLLLILSSISTLLPFTVSQAQNEYHSTVHNLELPFTLKKNSII